jgi:hypothetical protein
MNNATKHSTPPGNNIIWHLHSYPADWDYQREAISHPWGAALKQCFKSGNREAA